MSGRSLLLAVSTKLRGFRARAMSYGLVGMGEAATWPGRPRSVGDFLRTPAALPLFALILITLASILEETHGARRIRLAASLQLGAAVVAAFSIVWVGLSAAAFGFAWTMMGIGAVLVGLAARLDLARLRDARAGESVRLESLDARALNLSVQGRSVIIPLSAVGSAITKDHAEGRGVLVAIHRRSQIQGDANALPWVGAVRDADLLFLTEAQCNLDAEDVVQRINEGALSAREQYR